MANTKSSPSSSPLPPSRHPHPFPNLPVHQKNSIHSQMLFQKLSTHPKIKNNLNVNGPHAGSILTPQGDLLIIPSTGHNQICEETKLSGLKTIISIH